MAQSKKKLNIYIPQKIGNNKYRTALCKYHQANYKMLLVCTWPKSTITII